MADRLRAALEHDLDSEVSEVRHVLDTEERELFRPEDVFLLKLKELSFDFFAVVEAYGRLKENVVVRPYAWIRHIRNPVGSEFTQARKIRHEIHFIFKELVGVLDINGEVDRAFNRFRAVAERLGSTELSRLRELERDQASFRGALMLRRLANMDVKVRYKDMGRVVSKDVDPVLSTKNAEFHLREKQLIAEQKANIAKLETVLRKLYEDVSRAKEYIENLIDLTEERKLLVSHYIDGLKRFVGSELPTRLARVQFRLNSIIREDDEIFHEELQHIEINGANEFVRLLVEDYLYLCPRVGHKGRAISPIKVRTMIHGASADFEKVVSSVALGADGKIHDSEDPRVLKKRQFFRRTHVDEALQVLDVLMGRLRAVGVTRMLTHKDLENLPPVLIRFYLKNKPGFIPVDKLINAKLFYKIEDRGDRNRAIFLFRRLTQRFFILEFLMRNDPIAQKVVSLSWFFKAVPMFRYTYPKLRDVIAHRYSRRRVIQIFERSGFSEVPEKEGKEYWDGISTIIKDINEIMGKHGLS